MATTRRQPPPRTLLRVHRVVEILGILTVDGDQRQLTQVLAAGTIRSRDVRVEEIRRMQHIGGKFLRQVMPQYGKARREVRWPQVLEHFDDAAVRGCVALRALGDLDDHLIAVLGPVG